MKSLCVLWGNACFYLENLRNVLRWRPGQYALKKNSIRHFLAHWPIKRMQHGETYRPLWEHLILRKRRMHRLSSSTPPCESARHERAIAALAQQSHVPFDHVAQLHEGELAVLTVRARITDFLTILTTRKVREILRQRRHPAHTSEVPAPRVVDVRAQAQTAPSDRRIRSPV